MAENNPVQNSEKKESPSLKDKKTREKNKFNNPFSYQDPVQVKFVNCIMKEGKKTIAQRILKDTLEEIYNRGEKDPLKIFDMAIQNTTPTLEVRPKRIGGSIYQIPVEVSPKRQQTLSIRWILSAAHSRKGQPMYRALASELMDAAQDTGNAVNKKKEAHKMAQANKAFAHLARY